MFPFDVFKKQPIEETKHDFFLQDCNKETLFELLRLTIGRVATLLIPVVFAGVGWIVVTLPNEIRDSREKLDTLLESHEEIRKTLQQQERQIFMMQQAIFSGQADPVKFHINKYPEIKE